MTAPTATTLADAKIARDALLSLAGGDLAGIVAPTLRDVAHNGSDELLAKLRRLLK